MKCIPAIIVSLVLAVGVASAQADHKKTVTVFGESSTQVMPDQVVWKLFIKVRDDNLDEVVRRSEDLKVQVLNAASRLGLDDDTIQIGKVRVEITYKQDDGQTTDKLNYYEVSRRLTLLQTDVENYEAFWREFASIQGLRFHQEFIASELESVANQVRLEALRLAKEKAHGLASVVGSSVGEAISISEFKPNPTQREIDEIAYQRGVVQSAGRPEGIKVQCRIYAVFELN